MYFIIFFLSFQYGAKIKRICFSLATPQSTLSTAPLDGSLICLSLRRGASRAEWWYCRYFPRTGRRTRRHFSALPRATNGRPYNRIPSLLSVFPRHPSVDFVDSSPRWEPYMPLLEERCPKGGVVASYRTAPLTSLFSTTTGDQWSPLQPYSTFQKFKKEKPLTSLFYYSPYLTP